MKILLALLAALAVAAIPAMADQMTLGGDGQIYICPSDGGTTAFLSSSSSCGTPGVTAQSTNSGSFEHPTGTVVFSGVPWSIVFPSTFLMTEIGDTGVWTPNNVTSAFTWDSVVGDIRWDVVSQIPTTNLTLFSGTLMVTSNNSPYDLVRDAFPVTGNFAYHVDFTLYGSTFSSGQIVAAPEPGTALLMGGALLGLAGLVRRRLSHKA